MQSSFLAHDRQQVVQIQFCSHSSGFLRMWLWVLKMWAWLLNVVVTPINDCTVCECNHIKGVIGCITHFYMLFEHKCVLAVCVHNHPIMIKNQAILSFLAVWHHTDQGRSHDSWLTWPSYLWPALSELWTVWPPLFRWQGRRQEWLLSNWGVLLLDVIMNIAVVIYSRNLSRWRRRGLKLL